MLPRQSILSRYLLAMLAGALLVWTWNTLTSPTDMSLQIRSSPLEGVLNPSHDIHALPTGTRDNTPVNDSKLLLHFAGSNEHMVGNESLNAAIKNMTLLHVNETQLREIIAEVNSSQRMVPSVDHKNAVNPHPFKYIINTPDLCTGKDVYMLAYIHTGVGNYKRRMVIRQTWGNPQYYPDLVVRVVFVMGISVDKPELQQALQFESEQYGDIVQENFIDAYRNLTYKGIAALKWITNHCSHAHYILKSDDDIFVNTFTLLRHLQSLDSLKVDTKKLLLCLVWSRMPVMRTGKWRVSEEDFKDKYYPTYCSGSAFTMSTDTAIAMHNVSYSVPFFWVDDFYITGLLPLKLNITHKQFMSTYVLNGKKLEEKFNGPQWFTYVFSHVHDLNLVQNVWKKMVALERGEAHNEVKWAEPGKLPDEKEVRRQQEEERKKKEAEKKKKEAEKKKKEAENKKKNGK